MRLICPNCGAQYEVADDVIPAAGRDVQCSNCGHTWLETPGGSEAAEAGIDLPPPDPDPDDENVAEPTPVTEPDAPQSVPANFAWHDDDPEEAVPDMPMSADVIGDDAAAPQDAWEPVTTEPDDNDEDDEDDIVAAVAALTSASTATVASTPPRREIAPEVAEILQQEAEREDQRRSANVRATLETQPDLGIEAGDPQKTEEARRRMARMRGEAAPAPGADTTTSRRDLLPDIEEINSTLRATTQRAEMADNGPMADGERRRGFRFGFGTIVIIALIAAGIYIAAPRIIAAVPATAGVLGAYVDAVDQARLWLDLQMQQILAQMNPPAEAAAN